MNDQIASIFIVFLWVLVVAVVARALLSWFPGAQDNQFARAIYTLTEPLLEPIRRIMPRTGIIDFSSLIAILLLYVMIAVVSRAADV